MNATLIKLHQCGDPKDFYKEPIGKSVFGHWVMSHNDWEYKVTISFCPYCGIRLKSENGE